MQCVLACVVCVHISVCVPISLIPLSTHCAELTEEEKTNRGHVCDSVCVCVYVCVYVCVRVCVR